MYFDALRHGDVLTITPSGRLDAVGAAELENYLQTASAAEPFSSLILDFRTTSYLSSAGLRVLLASAKKLQAADGHFALFGLQPYCRDVVRVAGMEKILNCFATGPEAYAFCGVTLTEPGNGVPVTSNAVAASGKFIFETLNNAEVELDVTGEIGTILHARLENTMVVPRRLADVPYSLGFGAMGNVVADYLPLIGHQLTFDRTVMWAPANGQCLPDYLIPAAGQGELAVQTGWNVALHGPFNEMVCFTADSAVGVELETLWLDLLHQAEQRHPGFKGMLWCSMLAEVESAYLTVLQRSPLLEHAPANGKPITHPANAPDWLAADTLPTLHNGLALINGLGLDLLWDISDYNETAMARIFSLGPSEIAGRRLLLHNHAGVFDPGEVEWRVDRLAEESRLLLGTGTLRKVGELQPRSLIKQAIMGIGYVGALEPTHPVDSLYARRLDYQLNRNQSLLRAYKNLEEPEGNG